MLGFFLFRAYRICFYCLVVGLISFNLFPFAFVNFCIFRKGVIIWEKMNVKCVIALNVKLLCEEKASKTHTNTPHLALHFWIGGLAGIQLSLEEKYQINVNGSFVWFRPTAVSTYHLDILSSFSFFVFLYILKRLLLLCCRLGARKPFDMVNADKTTRKTCVVDFPTVATEETRCPFLGIAVYT